MSAKPPVCDFCSIDTNPVDASWRFSCRMFRAQASVPELVIEYRGDWAACDDCRPLVEAEQWDALADRCFERDPDFYVRAMHAGVAHLSGLGPLPEMEVPPEREVEAAQAWHSMFWTDTWTSFVAHRRGPAMPLTGGEVFAAPLIRRKRPVKGK